MSCPLHVEMLDEDVVNASAAKKGIPSNRPDEAIITS